MNPFAWPTLVLLACFIAAAVLWINVRRNPPQRVVVIAKLEALLEQMNDELHPLIEHAWNDKQRWGLEGQRLTVQILLEKVRSGDL